MRKATFMMRARLVAVRRWLLPVATNCKSRDQQNQGVLAFKNAKYGDAVEHFKQAIALDPDNPNAQLVSGHRVHAAMDPGRRFAREQRNGEQGARTGS